MSVSSLAAEIQLADGLTLTLWLTTKVEKSVIILVVIRKLTVSNMEEQLILFLNTVIRRESRCFRLELIIIIIIIIITIIIF
jgi:heme/copper-type cytochrome/quinol oxidase subunit 4